MKTISNSAARQEREEKEDTANEVAACIRTHIVSCSFLLLLLLLLLLIILPKRMATLHTKEKIQLSGGFPPVSLDGRERGTKEKGGGRQLSSAKHKIHTERQSRGGGGGYDKIPHCTAYFCLRQTFLQNGILYTIRFIVDFSACFQSSRCIGKHCSYKDNKGEGMEQHATYA